MWLFWDQRKRPHMTIMWLTLDYTLVPGSTYFLNIYHTTMLKMEKLSINNLNEKHVLTLHI